MIAWRDMRLPSIFGHRVIGGVMGNGAIRLISALLQLGLLPIFVAYWGIDVYGAWILMATIPSCLGFSDMGLSTTAGNDMTMRVARGDWAGAVATFQSALSLALLLCGSIAIVALTLAWTVPDGWLDLAPLSAHSVRWTISWFVAYSVLSICSGMFTAGMPCAGLYPLSAASVAALYAWEGICLGSSVALGASPPTAAAVYAIARLAGCLGLAALLKIKVPRLRFSITGVGAARPLIRPSMAVLAIPLAQAGSLQLTVVAIGMASTTGEVAIFNAVRTLARTGIQLAGLLNHALMPEFSMAAARGNKLAQGSMIVVTLAFSGLLLLPGAIIFLLYGRAIVGLWTHGVIMPSQLVIGLFALVLLLHGTWQPISNLLLAINRHQIYAFAYLALSGICVPLTFWLAKSLGAAGGALALLALDATMCGLLAWLMFRILTTPLDLAQAARHIGSRLGALMRPKNVDP